MDAQDTVATTMQRLARALWGTVLLMTVLPLAIPTASTQAPPETPSMSADHSHMHHEPPAATKRLKSAAELEADKRFSEFNHRFAGAFVLLAGLLGLIEPRLAQRYPSVRYWWSVLFFAPGIYLLIWSDPESWPVGNQTLYYVITQNLQVLQHKLFSLILLGLGVVEFVRVRRNLSSVWLSSIFPALAGLGALLLLFHPHESDVGMGPEEHLAMLKIQRQHLGFAVAGFGVAVSKAVADVGRFHPRLMRNLFALFLVALALLLLFYTE